MNQGDIVGNLQFRADLMPACTIADQRGMSTRHNLRADLLQVLAHAFGIGSRYDDGCGAPQPVQEDPARLLSFGSAVAGSLSPYAGEDVIVEIRDRPECSQQLASFPTGRGAAPARRSTLDSVLLSIGCTKRSQDTALRDIDDLVKRGIRTRGVAGVEAPAIRWRKAQELESIKQRS
jgi:hypothetical protein